MLEATALIAGAVPLSEQAGVRLRTLQPSDQTRLLRWWNRPSTYEPRYVKNPIGRWINDSGKSSYRCMILVGGKPRGYCEWDDQNEITLYVAPEHRGKGVGTKAMRLLLHEAASRNKKQLVVITSRADFWIKLGFSERNHWLLEDADRLCGRTSLIWGKWGPNCGSS